MMFWRRGSFENHPQIIDGLRGIAVMAVVLSHADSWYMIRLDITMAYKHYLGSFGVQLFFLLSGYLIWLSAGRTLPRPAGIRQYLIHRATRIAPLYYINLAVVILVSPIVAWSFEADHSFLIVLRHIFFTQTLEPDVSRSINPVVWTLTHEALFYLFVPLLWQARQRIEWIALIVVAASAYAWLYPVPFVRGFLFVFPLFIFGSLFAERRILPGLGILFAATSLGVICGLLEAPTFFTTAAWAIAMFTAGAMLMKISEWATLPIRLLAPIGKISFSLYIWHYVLIDMVGPWWWSSPWLRQHRVMLALLFLATCFAVSTVSYLLIEKPSMTLLRDRLLKRMRGKPGENSSSALVG